LIIARVSTRALAVWALKYSDLIGIFARSIRGWQQARIQLVTNLIPEV
jgi:hypothetical protein